MPLPLASFPPSASSRVRRALVERALVLLALGAFALPSVSAEDLAKRYPATLSHSNTGLAWRCDEGDVWQLASFELALGTDFALKTKGATVALGRSDTNVLWAVVFPDEPAKLRAAGTPADGETTSAIFLRFAPSELGSMFPAKTVQKNGDAWRRALAARIAQRKIGHKWFTPAGLPTVVPAGVVLFDADTEKGARRSFELDRGAGKALYLAEFESKPVAPAQPISAVEAKRVFDEVWSAFDREYANFGSLPKLDWTKLGAEKRKQLARVETSFDLAAVLADGLARLEDLHVWVKAGEDGLPGWQPDRPLNASWKACAATIGKVEDTEKDLAWGRTQDGIGYANVYALSKKELVDAFDAALESLADTTGLVLDLRFDGGGDELLAQALAGRFVDVERVYSKNQYRSGPKHDDLGPVLERKFAPRGPWRYEAPVVVLIGRRVMSSAESFALMLAQCPQVTTMGDRTAGSSANPRRLEPGAGIVVNLPRWRDLDPAGNPIEHVGVAPKVKVDAAPSAFTDAKDPVLDAALAFLRKLPASERKPGKR